MAILRTKSRLTIPAPPPSPIPTGTGSRSAANETFKEFLEQSIQPPQLSLPESRFLSSVNPLPVIIDYRSLASPRDVESIARMLRSVKEFGAFRIVNHGISGEEILSLVNEAKCIISDSLEKDKEIAHQHDGNIDAIVQVRYRNGGRVSAIPAAAMYGNISQKMEKIARKLEAIAEELRAIFSETMGDQFSQKVKKEEKESILTVYRYNHHDLFAGNPTPMEDKDCRETEEKVKMSLHVPKELCEFLVKTNGGGHISFDASANAIVATIGKQLQDWTVGELKSARSETKFGPDLLGREAPFSIELKISGPNSAQAAHLKVISVADQILIGLLSISLYLFYNFLCYLFKTI